MKRRCPIDRLLTALVLLASLGLPVAAHAQEDDGVRTGTLPTSFSEVGRMLVDRLPEDVTLVDQPSLTASVKNLSQTDEAGNSQFGVGLDYRYRSDWSFDAPIRWNAGIQGQGFVSFNDPNSGVAGAASVANFNSLLNGGHIEIPQQVYLHGHRQRVSEPPPLCPEGSTPEACRAIGDAWKQRIDEEFMAILRSNATRWSAFQAGVQARAESDQGFNDTQGAFGVTASGASGWLTNKALGWARFLVPADPYEPERYGKIFQSPAIFFGFDYVFGARYRAALDGTSRSEFPRVRLETSWTTEMLFPGMWPFVDYVLYHELSAPDTIVAASKDTTHFVEAGVNYYLAGAIERLKGGALGETADRLTAGRGPFVGIKYAWGRLPPYLERDEQVSLGFGLVF